MSVPEQRKPDPPSTKLSLTTDFLRSAIAASSPPSPLVHIVGTVQLPAAALASSGESVKCSTAATRTASGDGSTGLKSSITCEEPSVHGVHASLPEFGSMSLDSMR